MDQIGRVEEDLGIRWRGIESVRRRVSLEVSSLAMRETRLHFVGTRVDGVSSTDGEPAVTEESGFLDGGKR